jgi:hypothetical protein
MIQPGHGTVLYNRDWLLEVCSSDINYNLNENELNVQVEIEDD